ncbi:uncharacterized protein [Asterias amurensis]|uniref:uncharacterized protein n=1 Tax=Asterias amurensis TaxID=7602 RepID=UPI003AB2AF2F
MKTKARFLFYCASSVTVGLCFGLIVHVNNGHRSVVADPLRGRDIMVVEKGDTRQQQRQPSATEFVISHYKEKLDWLKPIAKDCHVYDKGHGKSLKPSFPVKQWEELPNVGRESHTYLYHIIKYYESLADVTVFLPDELADYTPEFCFPAPTDFLEKAREGIPCLVYSTHENWGSIKHIDQWKLEYDQGLMRHAKNATLGEFYQTVFGRAPPQAVDCCLAGCFSATRRCLQKHPKKFYQKLISFLDDHSNPEEGHYLNRLWHAVVAC